MLKASLDRLPARIANGVLVLFLAIIIFLVLGEILLRVFLLSHIFYDVEMTRYALSLKQDAGDPRIGHVHRPNGSEELMGVPVRINSDGLRDTEHSISKRDGRYRIAALGDSLTFGWGVREEEAFPRLLETQLNEFYPVEVINFGTGNYNTSQEVYLFLEKGLKYNPDKVVLFYFINDAEPTPKRSPTWFLGYSRLLTLYWSRLNIILNKMQPAHNYIRSYSALYSPANPGWEAAKEAFLILQNVCSAKGIRLQVVLLPELHNLKNYPFKKEHGQILTFLADNRIQALDLTPSFEGIENPETLWVAKDDAHPNGFAHSLIAKYSIEFVKER